MSTRSTQVSELLARLSALGVEVQVEGDRLLCHGSRRLMTRELQAELASRKQDILEHFRAAAVAVDGPLSYAQQRLWFLDQMHPGVAAYTLSMAQHLAGPLDTHALRRALSGLVRRHEILRSAFPTVDGAPVQRVAPADDMDLAVVDLRHIPAASRREEACRLARAETARPFDLAAGRLLRTSIYVLDDASHVFVLSAHHMIADGWSVALIGRELALLYGVEVSGEALAVGAPPTQYASYARWQREAFAGVAVEEHLRYWKEQLSDAPRVLELPLDRARPPVPSHRGGRVEFEVDSALTATLRNVSRSAGASLFMLLLTASAIVLARHARASTVVIGTPVAGRDREEWASIIGCFVNTLAMRVDLAGDPPFTTLLRRVREVVLEGLDHQALPFEQVVESLQPDRDLSRSPVVQVSVGLHNAPGQTPLATFPLPGLEVTPIDIGPGTVRFDLELDVWEVSGGMHGCLLYARDLFDEPTITRMASQFQALLSGIAANPECVTSRLPMVSAEQRRELLAGTNPPAMIGPRERLLHELVREASARTPEAVAVVCGDAVLTYAQLELRASMLAGKLREAGVRPGEPVGLCVARGPAAVIAMLAILQAGAAFVPVDPEHPLARIQLVVEDSGMRTVLTEPALLERFCGAAMNLLCVDMNDVSMPSGAADAVAPGLASESLAYVMYTSGSTGRPKGIAVPHRAVVGLLDAMHRVLPLGARDVFLAVTTFAFDISVLEVFLPLVHGAQLVIAEREETLDGVRLAEAIARRGVTAMQATPATWSMLVDNGWTGAAQLAALCGGEAMPPGLAVALRARCARVWNVYGPTEATIWSSADVLRDDAPVTIGCPLANTEMHVLDEHLEPQPVGLAGEIWIGGEGLASGYLGRPGLTAENFVPDPFTQRFGARMYRTGDLGRLRDDGRVECLGRVDYQVKFRGFRIEPGDIESVLLAHSSVAKAVVTVSADAAGERRLVAYLVAESRQDLDASTLRQHLQAELPAYLVPSDFVVLDALPSTPNGKVDRSALPAPSRVVTPAGPGSVPNTEVERALADIWAGVLGVARVGAEDSFFGLGGHSLLLTRVRAEILARLGRDVAVLDLFRWPTIRALAAHLSGTELAVSEAEPSRLASRQRAALDRVAQAAQAGRVRNG